MSVPVTALFSMIAQRQVWVFREGGFTVYAFDAAGGAYRVLTASALVPSLDLALVARYALGEDTPSPFASSKRPFAEELSHVSRRLAEGAVALSSLGREGRRSGFRRASANVVTEEGLWDPRGCSHAVRRTI